MKKTWLLLIVFLFVLSGCKKEEQKPVDDFDIKKADMDKIKYCIDDCETDPDIVKDAVQTMQVDLISSLHQDGYEVNVCDIDTLRSCFEELESNNVFVLELVEVILAIKEISQGDLYTMNNAVYYQSEKSYYDEMNGVVSYTDIYKIQYKDNVLRIEQLRGQENQYLLDIRIEQNDTVLFDVIIKDNSDEKEERIFYTYVDGKIYSFGYGINQEKNKSLETLLYYNQDEVYVKGYNIDANYYAKYLLKDHVGYSSIRGTYSQATVSYYGDTIEYALIKQEVQGVELYTISINALMVSNWDEMVNYRLVKNDTNLNLIFGMEYSLSINYGLAPMINFHTNEEYLSNVVSVINSQLAETSDVVIDLEEAKSKLDDLYEAPNSVIVNDYYSFDLTEEYLLHFFDLQE